MVGLAASDTSAPSSPSQRNKHRKVTIMNITLFLLSLSVAVLGPLVAISYLRPILVKVLHTLCDADGGAEFWVRSAYLLAVCGTLLLMLSFGEFRQDASVVDTLRRALWLVFAGVFATVAAIANQVWGQVRELLADRNLSAQAARRAETRMARRAAGDPHSDWPQ
jgi:hypothetical protein